MPNDEAQWENEGGSLPKPDPIDESELGGGGCNT